MGNAQTAVPAAPADNNILGLPAELVGFKGRAAAYVQVKGAARVEVLNADGGGSKTFVTRGVRVNGSGDQESLVHQDGSRETGLPLSVITYALLGGVVTDAELDAILAARKKMQAAQSA